MFYAYDLEGKLIVAAAEAKSDFEAFRETYEANPSLYSTAEEVDLIEVLFNNDYKGLKRQPFSFDFDSEKQKSLFLDTYSVKVVSVKEAATRSENMTLVEGRNPWVDYGDSKTIAEMHDLVGNDQWDNRSAEQIEEDEKVKKQIEKAKKDGRLTGDSFGGKSKGTARVRSIHSTLLADGEIRIDKVLAQKGSLSSDYDYVEVVKRRNARENAKSWSSNIFFFDVRDVGSKTHVVLTEKHFFNEEVKALSDDTIMDDAARVLPPGGAKLEGLVYEYDMSLGDARELFEKHGFEYSDDLHKYLDSLVSEVKNHVGEDEDDLSIDANDAGLFQRLDVETKKLVEIVSLLSAKIPNVDHNVGRDCKTGCWIAFLQHKLAEEAKEVLDGLGITSEITAVNAEGTPIIAKGVSGVRVVDQNAKREETERPWNNGATALTSMTPDELEENKKSYNGAQFLYTAMRLNNGASRIYVVPATYFKDHGTMWNAPLNIDTILPTNMKEVDHGVYETRYWDFTMLNQSLQNLGYRDSILLRQYVNTELL